MVKELIKIITNVINGVALNKRVCYSINMKKVNEKRARCKGKREVKSCVNCYHLNHLCKFDPANLKLSDLRGCRQWELRED